MADYCQILGASRSASQEEIRKVYRRRARRLHPDVVGPEKVDKFRAVSEAYDIFSDVESRRMYDLGGMNALRGGDSTGGFSGFTGIFETFFGGMAGAARGPASRERRDQGSLMAMTLSLRDVVFGVERDVIHTLAVECEVYHGTAITPGTEPVTCLGCDDAGTVQRVANSIPGQIVTQMTCPICHGFGIVILTPYADCSGQGRVRETGTVHVQTPAGVEDDMRIRVAGKSEAGVEDGRPGNLFTKVYTSRGKVLHRDGGDLVYGSETPMTASAPGCSIKIEIFDGPVTVDVPEGADAGHTIKLSGLGVGRFQREGRGDLRVALNIKTLVKLNDAQHDLSEKLAYIWGEGVPVVRLVQQQGGFLSRLRDKLYS